MLRFALGDVPVSVHFSFLVIAFIGPGRELWEIGAWTVAVFLAILAHEAGHAFTARAYGARQVAITLFALGGVTTYPVSARLTPGKRFVVAAAGSGVGIVIGGAVGLAWLGGVFDDASQLTRFFALSFIWAALFWGILNWIPIRPLDGGQMLTSALQMVAPRRGASIARVVSAIAGAGVAIAAFAIDQPFLAIFVVFITLVGLRRDPEELAEQSPPPGEVAPPASGTAPPAAAGPIDAGAPPPRRRDEEPPPDEPTPHFPI